MKGIDVSRHDLWPFKADTETAYQESGFVIVKSTQGTSYSYTSYFYKAMDRVLKDGKLAGAYHYAAGKDPVKEADYFLKIVDRYLGKIILALDWEEGQNAAWGSKTWAKKFIERVKEKTGLTCWLYTGTDGVEDCKNCVKISPLWFAGYPTNKNSWTVPRWPKRYNIEPWDNYLVWQFTSGGEKVDRNTTTMTAAKWKAYATPKAPVTEDPKPTPAPEAPKTTEVTVDILGGITMPTIKRGSEGKAVKVWQAVCGVRTDGNFGPKTEKATRELQMRFALKVDGIVGPKTWKAGLQSVGM